MTGKKEKSRFILEKEDVVLLGRHEPSEADLAEADAVFSQIFGRVPKDPPHVSRRKQRV